MENNDFFDLDLFDSDDQFTVQESDADRTLIRLSEYLLDEVAEMFDLVQSISQEVTDVHSNVGDGSKTKRELFAVVDATAEATNTILEQAELLESIARKLSPEHREAVTEYVTKIYEACTFQDITGQRIRKVVIAIIAIEDRLSSVLNKIQKNTKLKHVVHADESTITKPKDQEVEAKDDKALMQGPSLDGVPSQEDIDNMFKNL